MLNVYHSTIWKWLKKLNIETRPVINKNPKVDDYFYEVMDGIMIGDGNLNIPNDYKNVRFQITQTEEQSEFIYWIVNFLDKYNKKMNKTIKGITDEAMKYLIKCEWPGNIRQLENEIERAVTLVSNDSFIKPDDLSEEVFKYFEHTETLQLLKKVSLKDAVEELERDMIIKALKDNNWNQTQAAKELGLSRQGLIKKIKRYELAKYDI